jgi:CBS domain-containing protein
MQDISIKYGQIKTFHDANLPRARSDMHKLNSLHNQTMKLTVLAAVEFMQQQAGPPPSQFCFFVTGSAGRQEQGIWSDQDHGLIYESSEARSYFLSLGAEISQGLVQTGYKECDGKVMASNPFWCKSREAWDAQVNGWLREASWETIRHLLTFIDSRPLYGEDRLLVDLKAKTYDKIHKEKLLPRILQNTMHVKKSIGIMGQLLVETHGPYTGMLNIKDTGLFPYVNAARLLAIHGHIMDTSTLGRLEKLPNSAIPLEERRRFAKCFSLLQSLRLAFGVHKDYDSGHFVQIGNLSKQEKQQLKEALRDGLSLYETVRKLVEKEDLYGHE